MNYLDEFDMNCLDGISLFSYSPFQAEDYIARVLRRVISFVQDNYNPTSVKEHSTGDVTYTYIQETNNYYFSRIGFAFTDDVSSYYPIYRLTICSKSCSCIEYEVVGERVSVSLFNLKHAGEMLVPPDNHMCLNILQQIDRLFR